MVFRLAAVGLVVAAGAWHWAAQHAHAQKLAPFTRAPAHLECFQSGVKILDVDTNEFIAQGRGDYYMEYTTTDGRRGQLRFPNGVACALEQRSGREPSD